MKTVIQILLLSLIGVVGTFGQGVRKWTERWEPGPEDPWLGVRLEWVDRAIAAHLKGIPSGFGLLVDGVEAGGPAEKAGLQELDVIWKFDDQLIANQWQLYSLMKYKGVGHVVQLTLTRAGEEMILPLTLALRPTAEKQAEANDAVMKMIMPPTLDNPVAVKQVFVGRREAIIEEKGTIVSLSHKRDGYEYLVSENGKLIDRGSFDSDDPAIWLEVRNEDVKRKLKVLFESLANAEEREERDEKLVRIPRVRRVPSPAPPKNPPANSPPSTKKDKAETVQSK